MSRFNSRIVVALALILPTSGYPQPKTPLDVCAIADHLQDFVGKRVSFSASVMSDGIERTILVAVDGSYCRRPIVPVAAPDNVGSQQAVDKLAEAIHTGGPGTLDKRIKAVFTGVISLGDPERFMLAPGDKMGVLSLMSVDDLNIEVNPSPK